MFVYGLSFTGDHLKWGRSNVTDMTNTFSQDITPIGPKVIKAVMIDVWTLIIPTMFRRWLALPMACDLLHSLVVSHV